MANGQHGPDDIDHDIFKAEWLQKIFPIEELKMKLEENRFRVLECHQVERQNYTWHLRLEFGDGAMSDTAFRQKLAQIVDQFSPLNGVRWRVDSTLALIHGQMVEAEFRVEPVEQVQ